MASHPINLDSILDEFHLVDFQEDDLEEFLEMAKESSDARSPLSAKNLDSKEEMDARLRFMIAIHFQIQDKFNELHGTNRPTMKLFKRKGKIVASHISCDLRLFYSDLLPLVKPQENYGITLFNEINPLDYQDGTANFAGLFFVRKQYLEIGLGRQILLRVYAQDLFNFGVRYQFVLATSPISILSARPFGQTVIAEQTLQKNGESTSMWICRFDCLEICKNFNQYDLQRALKPKL